jgi:hypothetical protein
LNPFKPATKIRKTNFLFFFQYSAKSLVTAHWFSSIFHIEIFSPFGLVAQLALMAFLPPLDRGNASRCRGPKMPAHPAIMPSTPGNQGASPHPLPRTNATWSPPLLETKT